MNAPVVTQVPWIDQILDLMTSIEPEDSEDLGVFQLTENTKPYIENAMRELVRACFNQAGVKKGMELTPYQVGAMVGHKWDLFRRIGEEVFPSLGVPKPKNPEQEAIFAKVKTFLESVEQNLKRGREEVLQVIGKCLVIALNQSPRETREYLDGFTKALNAGTLTKTGKPIGANSRTLLYCLVLMFGPTLENRFKTVNEFHAWVERTQGHNVAGNLERFQKFCNSIELHFKKPGRLRLENKETEKKTIS